jgi:hypothetical protein
MRLLWGFGCCCVGAEGAAGRQRGVWMGIVTFMRRARGRVVGSGVGHFCPTPRKGKIGGSHTDGPSSSAHSSSDGQRIETQIPTINARHGSKYFGLKKGVSAHTLMCLLSPFSMRRFGPTQQFKIYGGV